MSSQIIVPTTKADNSITVIWALLDSLFNLHFCYYLYACVHACWTKWLTAYHIQTHHFHHHSHSSFRVFNASLVVALELIVTSYVCKRIANTPCHTNAKSKIHTLYIHWYIHCTYTVEHTQIDKLYITPTVSDITM